MFVFHLFRLPYIPGKMFCKFKVDALTKVNFQANEMYKYETNVQTYFCSYCILYGVVCLMVVASASSIHLFSVKDSKGSEKWRI
jgi:hypothetical protein